MESVEWTVVFETRTFDLWKVNWLTGLLAIFLSCAQVCQELNSSWAWELEQNRYMQMSMESKSTILKVPHTFSSLCSTPTLHLYQLYTYNSSAPSPHLLYTYISSTPSLSSRPSLHLHLLYTFPVPYTFSTPTPPLNLFSHLCYTFPPLCTSSPLISPISDSDSTH